MKQWVTAVRDHLSPEREAEIRDSFEALRREGWLSPGVDEILRELDAARADLAELVAALPRCDHDGSTSNFGCEPTCTCVATTDSTDQRISYFACDEHTGPEFVDLPWAATIRRLTEKGTL